MKKETTTHANGITITTCTAAHLEAVGKLADAVRANAESIAAVAYALTPIVNVTGCTITNANKGLVVE
jgi:hypothetical protein